jgi:nucleotide-binding universal stress UspA family protein
MKMFSSETIQKILIPTDGSDHSNRAAEYGIGIAKVHDAQIIVVYVVDEIVIEQFSNSTERKAIETDLRKDGERFTNYTLRLADKTDVKATSMLVKGRPYEQIVDIAKRLDIDLIVMGTYGRRGSERILLGSVAERVIEYSPCPVLVIK